MRGCIYISTSTPNSFFILSFFKQWIHFLKTTPHQEIAKMILLLLLLLIITMTMMIY